MFETKQFKLKKGESIFERKSDILLYIWRDKREIWMFFIIYKFEMVECIVEYNLMNGARSQIIISHTIQY